MAIWKHNLLPTSQMGKTKIEFYLQTGIEKQD